MEIVNRIPEMYRDLATVRAAVALPPAEIDEWSYGARSLFRREQHWMYPCEGAVAREATRWTVFHADPPEGPAQKVWTLGDRTVYDVTGAAPVAIEREFFVYFMWASAPGFGTDVCGYCGADNGIAGEYRVGFDCVNCGGN